MPERAPACSPNRSRPRALALGELRPLAGLLEAGLLALLDARVARQEAAALELAAQVRIGVEQRAADAVAQRARLRGDAAALHAGHDVHAVRVADRLERLADVALKGRAREEDVERAAVDRVPAGARQEDHAGDRRLALAGSAIARAGAQVDRDGGDRLVGDLVGLAGRGVLVVIVAGERVGPLLDDVDLEVGAGDLGLDARRLGLVVLVVLVDLLRDRLRGGRRRGGRRRGGRRRGGRRRGGGLRGGLVGRRGERVALRALLVLGRLDRRLLGGRRLLAGALVDGGGGLLLRGGRGLLRLLLGRRAVVGHQLSSSIGVGFCAACG